MKKQRRGLDRHNIYISDSQVVSKVLLIGILIVCVKSVLGTSHYFEDNTTLNNWPQNANRAYSLVI